MQIDYTTTSVRENLLVVEFASGGTMIMMDEVQVLDTVNALCEAGIGFALRPMTDVEWADYVAAMLTITL